MASANSPLEFTGGEREIVAKLTLAMKGVAAVLLLLAGINLVGGALTLVAGSAIGLLAVVEGVVMGLLGLIMLSSSADVGFMLQTTYTSVHLGNALQNLSVFYKAQFSLAVFLIIVAIIRLLIG